MRIAINTRFILKDYLEGYGNFVLETSTRIALQQPEHQFLFVFDRTPDPSLVFPQNVTMVVKGPPARHPMLWWYWYNYSFASAAREFKSDVILSPDGFCSLNTKIPQCIVIHDLAFLHFPKHNKAGHTWFYKTYTPKFLNKAKVVATVSEFTRSDLIKNYNLPADKIDVIYSGVSEVFSPESEEEKSICKSKYTDGNEYFLFSGAIHPRKNLLNLLKAFSLFKNRLKSSMKLVITGRLAWNFEEFTEKLKSYKYKHDVILTGYVERNELVRLTASAYAMVYPSLLEGFGVPPLEAMKCGVPVVASSTSALPEICGDAALFANPDDATEIAEKMMLIYKDEDLRQTLITKGFERSALFNWDKTSQLLWICLIKAYKG